MPSRVIKTQDELDGWVGALRSQPLPLTVSFVRGAKRSNPQNKTIHMWYHEAATALGDTTFEEVRAECKLIFGVPILRRDDAAFMLKYDRDFKHFDYETKRKVFEALDPAITSLMTTKQLKEFMDGVQRHFAQAGVCLTDPDAHRYARELA